MEIKTKEFFTFYAPDCRKRHSHKRTKNRIIEFVIQLEILIECKWHPIIRYDTSHQFSHCDIIHRNGKTEKLAIPSLDYADALTYADDDLNENWSIYLARFLKEVEKDER